MLLLLLIWFVAGLLIGALAYGAGLRPLIWGKWTWWGMLALGACASLLAGWLSTLVLGSFFALPVAIWFAILCAGVVGVMPRFRQRA